MTPQDKIAEYKNILEMIEGVSVDDDFQLSTIDAFTHKYNYDCSVSYAFAKYNSFDKTSYTFSDIPKYTTSLDACVSIQEDGWYLSVKHDYYSDGRYIGCRVKGFKPNYGCYLVKSPWLATEPLARLHAILQTKIWRLENE